MKTKLTSAEKWIIVLTVLFAAAMVALFFWNRGRAGGDYTVVPEKDAAAEEVLPTVINVNTASAEELATLDGIGTVLAERIVAYREENGPFQTPEELLAVEGIGESKLEDIREQITIGEETP